MGDVTDGSGFCGSVHLAPRILTQGLEDSVNGVKPSYTLHPHFTIYSRFRLPHGNLLRPVSESHQKGLHCSLVR